jgi:glucans biosynthesis protein
MKNVTRRVFLTTAAASSAQAVLPSGPVAAQAPPAQPSTGSSSQVPSIPRFGYNDVQRRARELAKAPFQPTAPLPDPLARLDFDAWRDIRFRPEKAIPLGAGGAFRLQLFHLGFLYKQPVTINTIRDGIPTPVPYTAALFDYGRTKFDRPLPVNLGFAGFRLHYPINDPRVFDEVIAFLGASYYRLLGRGQRYGLSARGLAINSGTQAEEFPFFREFWIEPADSGTDRITIYGMLDGPSATGAFRFDLYPAVDSVLDVTMNVFPRRSDVSILISPLTSMFFLGEDDRRLPGDFRPQLHDSDGLLMQSGTGEWIWRPLRNPAQMEISAFLDKDVRGFGLLQRDRKFEDYQDIDLAYELRPSYWVEPKENWGEGRVELIELPTPDEANDNIVAAWIPKDPPDPTKPMSFGYRITAALDMSRLSPNARAVDTFQTQARALGSKEVAAAGSRRFIIDFAGGDLAFYLTDPSLVELVPTTTTGKILRSFLQPNPHINGFRAAVDVVLDAGQSTDLRAFLRAGSRTLTETWTFPWKAD